MSEADFRPEGISLTVQRLVEAFKFGYAQRMALGDARFVDVEQVWPLTPKIHRARWAFLKFDMRHRA